jgi:fructokinase
MSEAKRDVRYGALEAGGTKMVLAVTDADGAILEREEVPTLSPDDTLPGIVDWFAARDIDALGIGAFGPVRVDPKADDYGTILDTPKTSWKWVDLIKPFSQAMNIPVAVDTDVNVACLGEAVYGAAKGLDNVVYLTVGTGIGAGVLSEGRLVHGNLHPEAGHIRLAPRPDDPGASNCPFHPAGCLEGLASGPAIEARYGVKGHELADQAHVWELEAYYLAQGLTTFIMCYAPQKIILGGGVMKQTQLFDLVRKEVLEMVNGYLNTDELNDIDNYIVPAGCGGDQGILGCMVLAKRALEA